MYADRFLPLPATQEAAGFYDVLVASARHVDYDSLIGGHLRRHSHDMGNGMGGLEGGDDPFRFREGGKRFQGRPVVDDNDAFWFQRECNPAFAAGQALVLW